jgi:hypothetical protein
VHENRAVRRIFGPKREEAVKAGEICIMKGIIIYTPHQIRIIEGMKWKVHVT